MRRTATALVGMMALGALAGCGSRVDGQAATVGRAPAVTVGTAAPGVGGPTSVVVTTAPTTAPPTTAASTTAAPVSPAPTAKTPPTTRMPSTTVAGLDDKVAYCAAAKTYSVDDLLGLGRRIVADPAVFASAYEAMVASSPADQRDEVKALGPLTRTAVALVQKGEITTPEALQAWLATAAPRADLEEWVKSQQTLVPKLKVTCA